LWSALVRSALHRLRHAAFHPANWRPNLLILGGDIDKRPWLLQLGSAIVQGRGIVTYVRLLEGDVQELADEWRAMRRELDDKLREQFPNVFGKVDLVDNKYRGAVAVSQAYGMGTLEANTIMLGWPTQPERQADYVRMLRDFAALDRSLLIVRYNPSRGFGRGRRIDIWWGGLQQNGGLMLLLAFLITAHDLYRGANVVVRTVIPKDGSVEKATERIDAVLNRARLNATASVIVDDGRSIADVMHEHSRNADLAIIGLRLPPKDEQYEVFFERIDNILNDMPTTVLVRSARTFEGEPVLFDKPEVAAATDEASDEA
jgi:nucleotide-binding universal stress UspA family protein